MTFQRNIWACLSHVDESKKEGSKHLRTKLNGKKMMTIRYGLD